MTSEGPQGVAARDAHPRFWPAGNRGSHRATHAGGLPLVRAGVGTALSRPLDPTGYGAR